MTFVTNRQEGATSERAVRCGLLAVFALGVRRRNAGAAANALGALVLSYLPGEIERRYDVAFRPWQRAYAEAALLTHAAGMLGPYDDTWWWDHLTHTHSATLLGGLVYAAARRRGRDPTPRVFGGVVALGVLWEGMEYLIHAVANRLGLEPILLPYGARDTALDLVFDFLGACLVVALGERLLGNLFEDADD